mgnify:FL=1
MDDYLHTEINFSDDKTRIPMPFFASSVPFVTIVTLSTISTCTILIISITARLYKEPLSKMVFWIIFADFIFCLPKLIILINVQKSFQFCNIIQGISHFGLISSFHWAACFAHGILIALKTREIESLAPYFRHYLFWTIIVPVINTIISMCTEYISYVEETNTCVHYVIQGEVDYEYIFYTGLPLLISCMISLMCYGVVSCRLREILASVPAAGVINLLVFPILLLICWLPNLTTNILIIMGVQVNQTLVSIFQIVGHSQGLLDALVYGGSNKTIRKKLLNMCICRRPPSILTDTSKEDRESFVSSDLNESLVHDVRNRAVGSVNKKVSVLSLAGSVRSGGSIRSGKPLLH